MNRTVTFRSALAAAIAIGVVAFAMPQAQAFTYDNHVPRADGGANLAGGSADDPSSGRWHFSVSGGQNTGAAAGASPFLSSSNPAFSSPVVPYADGAGTTTPRFLYNH